MDMSAIWDIARQELVNNIRNKWTMIFALVFGVLVVSLAYFGMRVEGFSGVQSFARTSASLLNLVLYIVPLIALIMGTLSFTGDRGSIELLFSQPISGGGIIFGKWLGLFFSIALSTVVGFSLAGGVIVASVGSGGMGRYLSFVLLALLLAMAFLTIAVFVTTLSKRKAKAFGFALFLWFFFVLFYDLLALGGSTIFRGEAANRFLFLSLLGNPVDMVRVSALILLDDPTVFGPAGAALIRFLGGQTLSVAVLLGALLVWIATPLVVSARLIGRQDI
jgi:Cu-processing system permease protein